MESPYTAAYSIHRSDSAKKREVRNIHGTIVEIGPRAVLSTGLIVASLRIRLIIRCRTGRSIVTGVRVTISTVGIVSVTSGRRVVIFSLHVRGVAKRGIVSVGVRIVMCRGMLRCCITGRRIRPRGTT